MTLFHVTVCFMTGTQQDLDVHASDHDEAVRVALQAISLGPDDQTTEICTEEILDEIRGWSTF